MPLSVKNNETKEAFFQRFYSERPEIYWENFVFYIWVWALTFKINWYDLIFSFLVTFWNFSIFVIFSWILFLFDKAIKMLYLFNFFATIFPTFSFNSFQPKNSYKNMLSYLKMKQTNYIFSLRVSISHNINLGLVLMIILPSAKCNCYLLLSNLAKFLKETKVWNLFLKL